MILHVFDARNNFVNFGIDCFENAGIPGHYLYFGDQKDIKRTDLHSKVTCIKKNKHSKAIIHSIAKNYSLIIFHGLLNENAWALKQINKSASATNKAWIIYGAELSNINVNPAAFLFSETKKLYFQHKPYRLLFPIIRKWNNLFQCGLSGSIKKIDYALHFMPQEVRIASVVCKKHFSHLWFTYIQLENFVGNDLLNKRCVSDGNILIGNSASYSSNHIEAFRLLSDYKDVNYKKVYVPLSYGNQKYAKDVTSKGYHYLGESFIPLLNFLPREEYHELLLSCSCVVMNHNRQQALGNIIVALWLGSRVYLNKDISTYQFLVEQGIFVFPLDNLNSKKSICFRSLNDDEIAHNREILLNLFSTQRHIAKLKEVFESFV